MGDQTADALTILDHELKRIRSAIWSALDAEDWETLRGLTYAAEALARAMEAIRTVPDGIDSAVPATNVASEATLLASNGPFHPSDGFSRPSDGPSRTTDAISHPSDAISHASDGPNVAYVAIKSELSATKAAEGGQPVELGGQPVELGAQTVKLGAQPVELGGQPVELGGQPVELGGQPVELGAQPVVLGAQPVELGAQPVVLGAQPVESQARPAAKQPKTAERKALQKHRETLAEMLHWLPTGKDWTMPDWCHWRTAVCIARAGLEAAKQAKSDRDYFEAELEQLSRRADEVTVDSPFFGFNTEAYFAKEGDWKDLAQAYEWLGDAFEAKEWLDVTPNLDPKRRAEIVSLIGQAERWVFETFLRLQFSITDKPQIVLRDWWKGQSKTHREFEAPKKDELAQLGKKWRDERDKYDNQLRKDLAMTALRRHIEDSELLEDQVAIWNDRLCELVDACLEAKVPPSSLELVPLLVDFLGVIQQGCKHRQATKIAQFAVDQYRKKDPEFLEGLQRTFATVDERLLDELKPAVKGKRILFVGGNKGQEMRRQAIERLFECELEWPDMEDDTNLNVLRPRLAHADIVCLLIRFSRHGYKDVLDDAKEMGKQVVVFRAGLHPNRLLHDLKEQLFAGRV